MTLATRMVSLATIALTERVEPGINSQQAGTATATPHPLAAPAAGPIFAMLAR